MSMAMKIATGQAEEQYVDGRPWTDEEMMVQRVVEPKSRKKLEEGKEESLENPVRAFNLVTCEYRSRRI